MATIIPLRGKTPIFGERCFFAENSTIIGDVIMGDDCSIWFNAVIRGDVNSIRIGNLVNIQDGAVVHCNYRDSVTIIEDNVSVGHNAIIHGAHVGKNVIIGMGAIVMDHSVIGEGSIIAAGTVITKNSVVDPGTVYGGTPGRLIRKQRPEDLSRLTKRSAEHYKMYMKWYSGDMER